MTPDPKEALARQRFMLLSVVRLMGAGLTMFALLIIAGRVELDAIVGYVLLAAGLGDLLVVPPLLVRGWKSSGQ